MSAAHRPFRELLVAIVLLVLPAGMAFAQHAERKPMDAWAREGWTQRTGLPSDQVNALAQSSDGYLWIGTPAGLARFNGQDFVLDDRSAVPELHDNDVRQLAIGRFNSLLVSTARGGLSFLDQGYWTVAGVDTGLTQDTIVAAKEDARGRLWVATATGGLDLFDGPRRLHYNSRNGLPSDRVLSLLVTHDGNVWVGTSAGLARIVDERVQTISVSGGLLPSGAVTALAESQDQALWVGTQAGTYRQRSGEHQFEKMTSDTFDDVVLAILPDSASRALVGTAQHGLLLVRDGRSESIRGENPGHAWQVDALLRGEDGSIWVGGNQGLLRLRDTPFSTLGREQGLHDENVQGVLETSDGDVWIGTHSGLERLHEGQVSRIGAEGVANQAILALARAPDGGLWVATSAGGASHLSHGQVDRVLDHAHGLPSGLVRGILEDADGTVWIATSNGLLQQAKNATRVYTIADGLPNASILSLHRDAAGRLWIGTVNGLAYRSGEHFVRVPLPVQSMVQTVYGFVDDSDGAVWISSDRGLLRWKDGNVRVLASKQGLPVDTVCSVVLDRLGNLWLTTPGGLVRIAHAQATAVAEGRMASVVADLFGESDGMPTSLCNGGTSPAAWLLSDGSLWLATARGIAQVHPERLADYRSGPPQTLLEEVRVDDRVVVLNGLLELGPDTRKLDVRFFALNYHLPKRIQYRYLLEGYDSDWSEIGEHTSVQFTNLPAGAYRLRIQAAIAGGAWSPHEADLEFRIGAHLWQQGWFDVSMAVFLLAGGWLAWVSRSRQIAANERRLQQLVDLRTEDLRRQTEKLTRSDSEKTGLLEQLRVQSEAFERQAREDALTGLANRRRVDEAIEAYFSESQRSGRPLGFALLDIDFFKRINDRFSHATGDAVLREIGTILRDHQRPGDLAARLGGEEFICILAGSDLPGARTFCERIRQAIEGHDWEAIAPGLQVTVSQGVVVWNGEESYSRLSSRADELLYRAKGAGRNRVEG